MLWTPEITLHVLDMISCCTIGDKNVESPLRSLGSHVLTTQVWPIILPRAIGFPPLAYHGRAP